MFRHAPRMMMVACVFSMGHSALMAESDATGGDRAQNGQALTNRPQRDCDDCDRAGSGGNKKKERSVTCPGVVTTGEMVYEFEGLDLDSSTVHDVDVVFFDFDPTVDVFFAYNADTTPHLRVFPQNGAMVAILEDRSFDDVTCEDVETVAFSADPVEVDVPVYDVDTVLVRTADGATFKLGHAAETPDMTVDFDFSQLCRMCNAETGN